MLIGIDASRVLVQQRTGTEVYSLNVIRQLLHIGDGHQFRLYWRESPPASLGFVGPAVQNRVVAMPRVWTHLGLGPEVTANPPSVLFVPAHVVPAVRRCPAVVTIHDVGYLHYPETYTKSRWWSLHLSTRFSASQARLIIADSKATKADLVHHYNIPAEKIRVVYLAGDPIFQPMESAMAIDEVKRRHGIAGEYFLHLGTLQPRKNIDGLVRAFAEFTRTAGNAHKLVLAGRKGWLFESIYRVVQNLGLVDAVVFVDYVSDEDLPALLNGATALVFPSYYEGFGLPALQAMACGVPVIASNVSSLPEVVGDAGLLIDPYDTSQIANSMARIVSDQNLRNDLHQRGLERAKLFSWEQCARETLAVLEEASS